MAGSPTFSTQAADTLVTAYLNQPEGNRDLRKVLAAARQFATAPDASIDYIPGFPLDAQPDVVREIAAMSQSQAYELLRADTRYQPTTAEQAEQLTQTNLDLAREIIDHEKALAPYKRNIARLKQAQSLIGQVDWQRREAQQQQRKHNAEPAGAGLSGLLASRP